MWNSEIHFECLLIVFFFCPLYTAPKDQGPLKGYLADLGYQPSQIYKVSRSAMNLFFGLNILL